MIKGNKLVEEWRVIEEFPDYEISNCGRIKTREREVRYEHSVLRNEHFRKTKERLLKVYSNDRNGYKFCQLYKNKKSCNRTIHRLVAFAFCEKTDGLDYVNHIT